MKLRKIYSNNNLFKTVVFHDGINIVMGRIKNPANFDKDSHNIGKTKLLELLNFLLLGEVDKNFFLIKNECFKNDIFYLVIEIEAKKFLTIRRAVNKPTKISMIKHSSVDDVFDDESNWDYRDIGLKSADNPKQILKNELGLIVNGNLFEYRKISQYLLRNQSDYNDVFRLNKFKGKDADWKPYLFELLGFNSEAMKQKYQIENSISESQKAIDIVAAHSNENRKEILKSQIVELEEKIKAIKEEMKRINFFRSDDAAIETSVVNLQSKIKELNIKKYNLSNEVALINETIRTNKYYDLEKTKTVFEEFKLYFGEQIIKDYNALCDFNNRITEERRSYLGKVKEEKQRMIGDINSSLKALYEELEKMQQYITEVELSSKYYELSEQVFELQNELEHKKVDLENSNISDALKKEKKELENNRNLAISSLENELLKENQVLCLLKSCFSKVILDITGKKAILGIKMNKNKNVDFEAEFVAENKDGITSESDGNTYKKLLCSAFDLALVISHEGNRFFNSIYHDGVLESLEGRKKVQYLKCVEKLCSEHDFQYIFTTIESDLPDGYDTTGKTCVEISDEDGDTLFGRNF